MEGLDLWLKSIRVGRAWIETAPQLFGRMRYFMCATVCVTRTNAATRNCIAGQGLRAWCLQGTFVLDDTCGDPGRTCLNFMGVSAKVTATFDFSLTTGTQRQTSLVRFHGSSSA
jgi:hypothetical protein